MKTIGVEINKKVQIDRMIKIEKYNHKRTKLILLKITTKKRDENKEEIETKLF